MVTLTHTHTLSRACNNVYKETIGCDEINVGGYSLVTPCDERRGMGIKNGGEGGA